MSLCFGFVVAVVCFGLFFVCLPCQIACLLEWVFCLFLCVCVYVCFWGGFLLDHPWLAALYPVSCHFSDSFISLLEFALYWCFLWCSAPSALFPLVLWVFHGPTGRFLVGLSVCSVQLFCSILFCYFSFSFPSQNPGVHCISGIFTCVNGSYPAGSHITASGNGTEWRGLLKMQVNGPVRHRNIANTELQKVEGGG